MSVFSFAANAQGTNVCLSPRLSSFLGVSVGCPRRGLGDPSQCGCPHRLAAGSVDSLTGKLRAIVKENDRAGDWEERLGLGNPAASLLVRKYLKCIKEEQATAGLAPKQATFLFVDKLARPSDHLDRRLEACKNDPLKCISCPEIKPILRPCFSLGTDLETLAKFGEMKSSGFLMMMRYCLTTHGEKPFVETDRIFLELEDVRMSKYVQ